MAHVKQIMFYYEHFNKVDTMRVSVALKPAGEVAVDVALPSAFYDCIKELAQTAADQHEQQMRAQILADTSKENHE